MKPWTFGDTLIGGKWRPGQAGSALQVTDPFSRNDLATIPKATIADVDLAFHALKSRSLIGLQLYLANVLTCSGAANW